MSIWHVFAWQTSTKLESCIIIVGQTTTGKRTNKRTDKQTNRQTNNQTRKNGENAKTNKWKQSATIAHFRPTPPSPPQTHKHTHSLPDSGYLLIDLEALERIFETTPMTLMMIATIVTIKTIMTITTNCGHGKRPLKRHFSANIQSNIWSMRLFISISICLFVMSHVE